MASPSEVIREIDALAVHCRPPLMGVDERSGWLSDWVADLQRFELVAIRAAFAGWRRGDNPKFPTFGQIEPRLRSEVERSQRSRQGAETGRPGPWRWLDRSEYDALTLAGKARYCAIAAEKLNHFAGPMFRNGSPSERVPERQRFADRAAVYRAEAARLQRLLAEARSADRGSEAPERTALEAIIDTLATPSEARPTTPQMDADCRGLDRPSGRADRVAGR